MSVNWLDLLGAGLSGGLVVKILDYIYQEYIRRSAARESAKDLIERHIDPILKSADELVGKIRSLAQSDFRELTKSCIPKDSEFDSWIPYLNLIYLFGQFWSRIQILRIESIFVSLGSYERGRQLLDFFQALEGKKSRLVERSWQRGIGEALIEHTNNGIRTITYNEFVQRFLSSKEYRKWFQFLLSILGRMHHTRERQRLLTYGVILHGLIDTLDNEHLVSHGRPGWPNKLTSKSKRDLKFRVFNVYLPFVQNPQKYFEKKSSVG
jgi:hypothetical protein